MFDRTLTSEGPHPAISDETLTAMVAYLGMLSTRTPEQAVTPTQLVKASDPLPGTDSTARAMEYWLVRHPTHRETRQPSRRLSRVRSATRDVDWK